MELHELVIEMKLPELQAMAKGAILPTKKPECPT